MAFKEEWPLTDVMWIYWSQSLIIGLFAALRMLTLKEFYSINKEGEHEEGDFFSKLSITTFFAVHYGLFHLFYALFLMKKQPLEIMLEEERIMVFIICVLGFLFSHGFSFFYNGKKEFKETKPNIQKIMHYPYKRIIPIHLTIILGAFIENGISVLMLFMALKTYADAHMHVLEHDLFRKNSS